MTSYETQPLNFTCKILSNKEDVFKFIGQCKEQFDVVFAGPPIHSNIDDLGLIFGKRLLRPKGWFVLEHTPRNDYKEVSFYKTERN
jgi:16S rRNA G966 N2-methylase RsmD